MKYETINYKIGNVLIIGEKFEKNVSKVHFTGFQMLDETHELYFCMNGMLIPMVDYTLDVVEPLMRKEGTYDAQLIELGGDQENRSRVFRVKVASSIDMGEAVEVEDGRLETIYQKYNDLYQQLIHDRDTGVFKGDPGDPGHTPINGVDYNTPEDREEFANEISTGAIGKFGVYYNEIVSEFDGNASSKEEAFNANASQKVAGFNSNASVKVGEYDAHAQTKTEEFDANASHKVSDYNTNAETKISEHNTNATEKTKEYNDNTTKKVAEYNANAQKKIKEYDDNVRDFEGKLTVLKADLSDKALLVDSEGYICLGGLYE